MPIAAHIKQCHHVHTNGVRCGSPAMRNRNQCFYHLRTSAKPQARPQDLPSLEDGNAIQLGIAQVIRRLLTYDIEYQAANSLLYAYKLAIFNLRNTKGEPADGNVVTIDPVSDPENAADVTEPITAMQQAGVHPMPGEYGGTGERAASSGVTCDGTLEPKVTDNEINAIAKKPSAEVTEDDLDRLITAFEQRFGG